MKNDWTEKRAPFSQMSKNLWKSSRATFKGWKKECRLIQRTFIFAFDRTFYNKISFEGGNANNFTDFDPSLPIVSRHSS